MFMYLLYIYKKPIILSLFKINTLNFTMYILTSSFKKSDFVKCNFNENFPRSKGLWFSFVIVKRHLKTNKLL